jgi:hypothetical protein
MNRNVFSGRIVLFILAILFIIACGLPASLASPVPPPQASATLNIQTETQQPTATAQPTLTAVVIIKVVTATPVAAPKQVCTVLQDLNLRFGPGTAYRPPIKALPANSELTPLGFAPQGIPGGSWAYVQDSATQDKGWVNAGAQYISCNVELAALPAVAFGTPPPFFPQSARSTDPDGNGFCVDPDSKYKCVGIFSDESLFQFQIIRNGNEVGENEGVEQVIFKVKKDGDVIYRTVENNMPYCIFGGNGPCNIWVYDDGVYKWTPGGDPVEPGEYKVEVDTTLNGDDSHWEVFFVVKPP